MSKKNNEEINRKKILLLSIIVIAFIISIIFIVLTINKNNNKEEFKIEGIEVTKNKDIIKDTKVDILDITNQILYNRNKESIFSGIINNNTEKDLYIKELYIIFKNKQDDQKVLIVKDTTIKNNDKLPFEVSFDTNELNTTKIDYEIIK